MNELKLSKNFNFIKLDLRYFHYTDNRKGSPMNFLAYMIEGNARIVTDSVVLNVNKGDTFFIPKNLSYQSYWYGNDKIKFISLGYNTLNTDEDTKYDLQTVYCDNNTTDKIKNIPTNTNKTDCKTLSLFYSLMSDILPLMKPAARSNAEFIIAKIKNQIQNNPYCSLGEIADKCKISEAYLYALFHKHEKTTPNEFKLKTICNKGVELLITTDKKIEEISNELNFSSSSYFRKTLKRYTGFTPREIRRNYYSNTKP